MSRVLTITLVCLVLIGCGASTATANLDRVDLDHLVLQPNGLPPNALNGTLTEANPVPIFGTDPKIAKAYTRLLLHNDQNVVGEIFVTLYYDAADARAKYDEGLRLSVQPFADQFPIQSPSIGDQATLQRSENSTALDFVRCHAYAVLNLEIPVETMLSYGKQLDNRLKEVACP